MWLIGYQSKKIISLYAYNISLRLLKIKHTQKAKQERERERESLRVAEVGNLQRQLESHKRPKRRKSRKCKPFNSLKQEAFSVPIEVHTHTHV